MSTFLSSSLFSGNSHFRINLYYEYVWQNAATNQTCIRTHLYMQSTDGYSGSGAALSCAINGNGFSGPTSIGVNQEIELGWRDDVYTHDVNGNISINPSGSCSSSWGISSASTNAWIALARLALAPPWASSTADTITPTTARLGNEISGYGHGTSCAMRMYWKKTTDASWSQTADQSDAAGYNYFNISGLKSNTTYQYFGRQWNNNGDTSDGAIISILTAPSGATSTPTNVLATTATIPATVALGDTSAAVPTSKLQYRKNGDSTWIDTATQQTASPSFNLSGLLPSTTYQYQLVTTNATGSTTTNISTFTTLPAGKLIMPDGTVKNAIPRLVHPNGSVTMVNLNMIE